MSVNVSGDQSLHWDASIGTDDYEKGIKILITGQEELLRKTLDSAKGQDSAFTNTGKAIDGLKGSISKLQAALDGFAAAKQKVIDIQAELAKLKAPGFADGKTPQELANLKAYITQTEGDLKALQAVVSDYATQLVNLSKIKVDAPVIAAQAPAAQKAASVADIISPQVITELKNTFGEIDAPTQKFIRDLIELELKLQNLKIAQNDLQNAFATATISEKEYADTSAFLVAGIQDISKQTETLTNTQKLYDASLTKSVGSIDDKKSSLAALSQAYNALNEAQGNSIEGKGMAEGIIKLKAEIKGLEPTKIIATGHAVETTRAELLRLRELMARNPNSPLFDTWKEEAIALQIEITKVRKEITEGLNPGAGVEAFAEGLRGLIGGFEAATGVIGLFTTDTKDYEEVTKNAASALALMNGVQEISKLLSKTSALNIYLLGLMHKTNTAAVIGETIATEANAVAAEVNAVATGGMAVATTEAAVAQRTLTAAMLANPAGLIIAGVAAIAVAYYALRKETEKLATVQETLAEVSKAANEEAGKEIGHLKILRSQVEDVNVPMKTRLQVVKDLQKEFPDYFEGIKKEKILLGEIGPAYDLAAEAILRKARANAAAAKIEKLSSEQLDLELKSINDAAATNERIRAAKDDTALGSGSSAGMAGGNFGGVSRKAKQKSILDEFNDRKKADQAELNSKASQINALIKITNEGAKETVKIEEEKTKKIKKSSDEIKGLNELLNEQKSLLQQIDNLHHSATQSGLTKEASELDKINEKYDLAVKKVTDYNEKVGKFNTKNPNNKVAAISTDSLTVDRATELQNATFKANAQNYIKSLDEQQLAFTDFEKAKLEVGEAKARELYAAQVRGATNYMDFLKQQKAEIESNVATGTQGNIQQQLEIEALNKKIATESQRAQAEEVQTQLEQYKSLLQATVTYNEEKAGINKRYDDLEKTLAADRSIPDATRTEKKQLLEEARKEELTAAADNVARQSELYKQLNADLIRYTKSQLAERLKLLQDYLAKGYILEKDGTKTILTPAMIADLKAGIRQGEELNTTFADTFAILGKIADLGDVFEKLGQSIGSNFLAEIGSAIKGIASQLGNLQTALSSTATETEKIQAGIAAAVSLVTMVVEAAAKRKEAERQYYADVIGLQREYNLSIQDQLLLQSKLTANVFVKNYEGEMLDGIKAAHAANVNYQKALEELALGKAKDGQHNAINWGAVGQGATAGAAVGAAVGSIVPVIGTAIGAVVGALAGAIIGIFGAKKKKDTFSDLMKMYPELIQKSTDGTEKFNQELAKSLIANNQVDEATKGILNNILAWDDKLKAAREQIKGVISDLAGSLGDDLRNSLVDAFKTGASSAEAFGVSVNKVLENILSNLLFNQVFSKSFDELQAQMAKSFDIGGDQSWVDDIATFFKSAPGLIEQFNGALIEAHTQSVNNGLNVFAQTAPKADAGNSLQGAIKGITQQQADLLAGQFGGLRMTAFEQLSTAKSSLNALNLIVYNTGLIADTNAWLRKFDTVGIKIK